MTRRRLAAFAATLSVAATAPLALSGPTQADDTGIAGGVESVMELSLETQASGGIAATVTATVPRTRLEVTSGATTQPVDDFDDPVTNERRSVEADTPKGGGDITITYGPQTP